MSLRHDSDRASAKALRMSLVPQDFSETAFQPCVRETIEAYWIVRCPWCGATVKGKTKAEAIENAEREGFSEI